MKRLQYEKKERTGFLSTLVKKKRKKGRSPYVYISNSARNHLVGEVFLGNSDTRGMSRGLARYYVVGTLIINSIG